MKEHLVRHGSKHKIQVHTTKRNKQQQQQQQHEPIQKLEEKKENRWAQRERANHKQRQHQTDYRLPAESHTDLFRSAKRANADIIITGQYTAPHTERDASTIQPCRCTWRTGMTAIQLYQALGTQHRLFSLGRVSSFICGGHSWREDS